jgi:DNA-binding response OmpR family regulator
VKILIVEDNADFRDYLASILKREQFSVLCAADVDEALAIMHHSAIDLVLSDVELGGASGVALCRTLRQDARTATIPLILLSGVKMAEEEQVRGLNEGADDYLLKPVSNKLLVSKIRTVIRRYAAPTELQDVLTVEDLVLDARAWTVKVKGRDITLTRKEFDLLLLFLRKQSRVFTPAQLLEAVWGYDSEQYDDTRTVKVHISSLRGKLGAKLAEKIVNVPGVGYKFDP